MSTETAVIYARVSDKKQVENDISIPGQIEKGKDKATSEGWDVVKVFKDEGVSGSSTQGRHGFEAAIEYCEIFNVKHFVIWSSSRFARNRLDALLYKKRLDDNGTSIHYLTFTVDRDTDAGRLMDGFLELMDEHKSVQTSRDTRRSMVRNAEQGFWNGGHVPFGYKLIPSEKNPKKKQLSINDDESWIIEKIFKMKSVKGLGCRAISNSLNSAGILNRDKNWSKSKIFSIFKSEVYIGQRIFGKTRRGSSQILPRDQWIIIESHDPIISIDLWDEVQEKLDRDNIAGETASRMPSHSNQIFAGLITCASCHSPFHVEQANNRSKRYIYYKCSQQNPDNKHTVKRFSAEVADTSLLKLLTDHALNDHNLSILFEELKKSLSDWRETSSKQISTLNKEIKAIDKRLSKLYDLLETTDREFLELGDLGPRIRELQDKKKKISIKLEDVKSLSDHSYSADDIRFEDVRDFMKNTLFNENTNNQQGLRELIRGFVDGIYIDRSGNARIEYKPQNVFTAVKQNVRSERIWLPDTDLLRTVVIEGNIIKKA